MHLLEVELEFSTFKNVSVTSSTLSRSGRDASIENTLIELVDELSIEAGSESSLEVLVSDTLGGLSGFPLEVNLFLGLTVFGLLVFGLVSMDTVILLVDEVAEWSCIDGNDRVLNQSIGSDQLVV